MRGSSAKLDIQWKSKEGLSINNALQKEDLQSSSRARLLWISPTNAGITIGNNRNLVRLDAITDSAANAPAYMARDKTQSR
jgi:hypothetical protein